MNVAVFPILLVIDAHFLTFVVCSYYVVRRPMQNSSSDEKVGTKGILSLGLCFLF